VSARLAFGALGSDTGGSVRVPGSLCARPADWRAARRARRKEPLEETAAEIAKATQRRIVAIPADLTKPEDAENFVVKGHAARALEVTS